MKNNVPVYISPCRCPNKLLNPVKNHIFGFNSLYCTTGLKSGGGGLTNFLKLLNRWENKIGKGREEKRREEKREEEKRTEKNRREENRREEQN